MNQDSAQNSSLSVKESLALIALGTVSPIYAIDNNVVLKHRPKTSDDFACQAYDIEVGAYQRLGDHPRVAKLQRVTDDGLVIERGECLRREIQSQGPTTKIQTKLRWAREAAEG
ncbi:uncharacterized protein LDX57_005135 [Aspergillus melleus]|uniref:uncharacterized protein n=1 Tax=Aspergillus melleus TaxID=138277 RepID=UPI001E8E29F9|nr:uncharacterized protein LDX57_005135 [Aspergillus melleus]KAH8427420.1 hypothetical protein LDX57_005135 [Aspergillus melleus]